MNKLKKITLNNFKFFLGNNVLDINENNLLIYGENGSGKSSIYWALYTFLHSVYKVDDADIQKYFDPTHDQRLLNRFAPAADPSSLIIEFVDNTGTIVTKTLSYTLINTKSDGLVKEAAHSSDFVNYRILSRLYDFSNKDIIDLFPLFEKEILMFIDLPIEVSPGVSKASDWWQYLKKGMQPRHHMHTAEYREFQQKNYAFNERMRNYLLSIVQSANEYLQDKFDQKLKIDFSYEASSYNEFIVGSTTTRNHRTLPPKIILSVEMLNTNPAIASFNLYRPQSFLNEARLTAIALSIRFAVIDEKYINTATKILVFDDLLVSLDMSNRDIVLEIILNQFPEYQIIMLTHDRMFFELAKHKVKNAINKNWTYYEMYESTKNGVLVPFIKRSDSYLEKAKANFYQKEYEMAGNFLRKQAEKFVKDILPKKYHFNEDYIPRNLNELILQCKGFARETGISTVLFDELDGHRKFVLNPSSHDNVSVAQFTYEMEKCILTFEMLEKLKFETVIKRGENLSLELVGIDGLPYKWEIELEDEAILLKLPGGDSALGPVKFGYRMFRKGIMLHDLKYTRNTLSAFFTKWYDKSDKAKINDYWAHIVQTSSGNAINSLKTF